jgi:acetate kinase
MDRAGKGRSLSASRVILSLNSGSSSRKFALYRIGAGDETLVAEGVADKIGLSGGRLLIHGGDGKVLVDEERAFQGHADAIDAALKRIAKLKLPHPEAVGHRIVHGGANHTAPERVTPALIAALYQLIPFAPLHLPSAIDAIETVSARFPELPQVACFDTAFHRQMPELAQRFPLPRVLYDQGIRRYGFHGISYEYIMSTLGASAPARIIVAHLGNGASMVAVRDGRSIDTTMGFTPAGGFMMGTRSGDLDPGILVYLLKEKGYDAEGIDRLVNHESGLTGVSASTSDMKTLLQQRDSDAFAREAIEMFCYQLSKSIGALDAALGGMDLLIFTGGIGEKSAEIRAQVLAPLAHLGIQIDPVSNRTHAETISSADSRCIVRVIPTNEDLMIARHTNRLLFGN